MKKVFGVYIFVEQDSSTQKEGLTTIKPIFITKDRLIRRFSTKEEAEKYILSLSVFDFEQLLDKYDPNLFIFLRIFEDYVMDI